MYCTFIYIPFLIKSLTHINSTLLCVHGLRCIIVCKTQNNNKSLSDSLGQCTCLTTSLVTVVAGCCSISSRVCPYHTHKTHHALYMVVLHIFKEQQQYQPKQNNNNTNSYIIIMQPINTVFIHNILSVTFFYLLCKSF